jgi:hypothetical protein
MCNRDEEKWKRQRDEFPMVVLRVHGRRYSAESNFTSLSNTITSLRKRALKERRFCNLAGMSLAFAFACAKMFAVTRLLEQGASRLYEHTPSSTYTKSKFLVSLRVDVQCLNHGTCRFGVVTRRFGHRVRNASPSTHISCNSQQQRKLTL